MNGTEGAGQSDGQAIRARVLVVDDDTNARSALAEILREEGSEVAVAADGLDALDQLGEFRPDVVLADVRMPRLDGISLVERVRARVDEEPPVFVLMSAHPPPRGIPDVPYFVGKPIDIDLMLSAVDSASTARRSRREGTP